jgi:hypothetical protein
MKNVIFPLEISNVELKNDPKHEINYQKIMDAVPRKPSRDELIFLLKYKKFVDLPNVYSMCGYLKVQQTKKLLMNVIHNKINGCLVETGVWKGGMAMWMKCILKYYGDNRKIWLFDTFKYFPDPNNKTDLKMHRLTKLLFEKMPSVDIVKNNFKNNHLFDHNIHFVEGEFSKTLNITNTGPIAILRLDCDYYDSTMIVLENYYWKINKGGYIIIDDYGNPFLTCKKAVDDFRSKYNIRTPIMDIQHESVYWIK